MHLRKPELIIQLIEVVVNSILFDKFDHIEKFGKKYLKIEI